MDAPRVAYSFFCDDIRQEVGGKTTFVGIYHGDIIFSAPKPVMYPRLCANVVIISEPDDAPQFFTVRMLGPDKKEIFKTGKIGTDQIPKMQHAEGALKTVLNFGFQVSPIQLTEEGFIEVWVETEREKMRAGRLYVSFREPEKPNKLKETAAKRPAKKAGKKASRDK